MFIMKTAALVALGLFLCVAGEGDSGYRDVRRCSRYCKESPQESTKFRYEPGHTYLYDYRIDTETGISVTSKEESRLHLSAVAEIAVISKCDFRLQLRDVKLEDSLPEDAGKHSPVPRMAELVEAIERHPLHFSFEDGKVEDLCPSSDDSAWVLNIKRGVLSVFQNTMTSFQSLESLELEKDVTGLCETKYSASSITFPTIVTKTKDLLSCTHRLDHYLSMPSTPYSSPVNIHSLPLIKSRHNCEQTIGGSGILERAVCNEVHLFRPFSNGENGAVTKVSQYLDYKGSVFVIQPAELGPPGDRTTLLYQHNEDELELPNQEHTVMRILEELGTRTKDGVQGTVPRLFAHLVTSLKTLKYAQLSTLFSNTQQSPLRKFLLDAMSLVGTPDGTAVMIDLYRSQEITDADLDSWLTSLSFQKKPSIGILAAVSYLLDESPRPKAILTASSLVHSYCHMHSTCDNEIVKEIIVKIEHLLGDQCNSDNDKDMELIILALKGISNAGIVVESLHTLRKCYEMNNPVEVRLAAIEAHRRLSCDIASRDGFLDLFQDVERITSTEIRIAAYLEIMRCPSLKTLQDIKDMLYKEEVNQVASFVWTHLTNMQETSSRWKQGIKALISNEFLKNKFNTDVRKFSRNYEASTYFDSLNAGAGIESNIIFTPESYLPRSATLNLTLDLFGESFNIFEVGARAQGFEKTVENILSSKGYFPDETVSKFLQNYREKNQNDLDSSIDKLSATFDAKSKLSQEPKASVYARIFGNEIIYNRFEGLEKIMGLRENSSYQDYMIKLALGEETEYMKSFSVLDASYVIPTASGLPLELAVNGSATVGLKYNGVMSMKEISKGAVSISGELIPSAAIEIMGTMSIKAFTAKAGITSVNRLNTNTYLGGAVKIVQGRVVDIKINVPREKMEILDVSRKLFMIHREIQHEIPGILLDREIQHGCSPAMISDIVGMKFCGELSYPNASQVSDAPYFPLTGPASLHLSLFKTDNFSAYEFGYKFNPDPKVSSINIHFDTVGSQIDRKLQFLGVYDRKRSSVSIHLQSPAARLTASGTLANKPDVKQIDISLAMDNSKILELHAGFQTSKKSNVGYYEPFFKLIYKDVSFLDLRGKVHYIEGVKYSADLTLKSQYKPIFIKGDLKMQNRAYFLNAAINSSFINGNIEGAVRKVSDYVSSHMKIQYSLLDAKEQSMEVTNKMLLSRKGDAELRSIQSSARFSEFPEYDFDVSWELQRGYNLFSHTLSWTFGGSTWETSQVYRHRFLDQHVDFQLLAMLNCKQNGIDYKFDVKHQTTDISIISHAIVHLGSDHKYIASFDYLNTDEGRRTLATQLSYSGFNASINGQLVGSLPKFYEMYLDGTLHIKSVNKTRQKFHHLRLSGTYTDQSKKELQDHTFQMHITGDYSGEVSGALQASANSMKQWLEFSTYGQKFREDVTYTFDRIHNVDVVVQLANRKYKGTAIISNTDNEKGIHINFDFSTKLTLGVKITSHDSYEFDKFELETTWNKERYPNNRIYLEIESLNNKSSFKLEYPGQQIIGELTTLPGSIESKLQWYPTKKITALVKWKLTPKEANFFGRLETPWRGLERQIISAEYTIQEPKLHCKVELFWQKENLILLGSGQKLMKNNGVLFADAKLQITSSIKNWDNLTLNLKYLDGLHKEANIEFTSDSQQSSLALRYRASPSKITSDFFLSLPWLQDSINSKFVYETDDHASTGSIDMTWALHKKVTGKFLFSRDDNLHVMIQFATPFEGYETFVSEMLFERSLSEFVILGKISFNDNLYLLSLDSSKTRTYGKLVTPFSYPLELSIEHINKDLLNQDTMVMLHNNQEIVKLFKSGPSLYSAQKKSQLLFDVNIPKIMISLHINKVIENKMSVLLLDGKWNSKTLSVILSNNCTNHQNNFELHYNGKISGTIIHTELEINFHHVQALNSYNTSLQLPGEIILSNYFEYDHFLQWKNILNMQTPWKSGTITNSQVFVENDFKIKHGMVAEVDSKQAQIHVTCIMNSALNNILDSEVLINTPWTHPVSIHFSTVNDDDTKRVQLTMNYKQKKTIDLTTTQTIQPMKRLIRIQLESSDHEPLSLTAGYDTASLTKNIFMKIEWAKKALQINSDLRFDPRDGFMVLTVKGFDSEQENLKLEINYDLRYKNKFIDFHGIFGRNEIEGKINHLVRGSYDIDLTLKSIFRGFENLHLSSSIDMYKPNKVATLEVIRNNDAVNISSSGRWETNLYIFDIKAESTFFTKLNISLYGNYDRRSANNQVVNIVYNYNNTITEFTSKLDHDTQNFIDAGALEMELKTPIENLRFLKAHVIYDNKNENNQRMKLLLARDDWKLQMDGESVFDDSGSHADLTLLLPFQDIQKVSASLKHRHLSNREQTLNIKVSCNNKYVEIGGFVVSYGNEMSANMEIRTNIAGYESIKGNFDLSGIIRHQKSISLGLGTNQYSLKLSGTLNISSLFQVDGNLMAEFPENQVVSAGLSYDLLGNENIARFIDCYLKFPKRQYQLSALFDKQEDGNIIAKLSVNSPVIVFEIISNYKSDLQSFKATFRIATNTKSEVVKAEVNIQRKLFNFQFVGPSIGYKNLSLLGEFDWETNKKSAQFTFIENDREFQMTGLMNIDPLITESIVNIYTPITNWEKINFHGKYELKNTGPSQEKEITLVAVKGNQSVNINGKLYYDMHDMYSSLNFLQTSLGTVGLMINSTSKETSITIIGDDYTGERTVEAYGKISETDIQLTLESVFLVLQSIDFSTAYSTLPTQEFISSKLLYRGIGSVESTFSSKLEINNEKMSVAMDPFLFDTSIRNFNSNLIFNNVFKDSVDPGLSLDVYINGSNFLAMVLQFDIDWESKLGLNFKFLKNDVVMFKSIISGTPKFPPGELHVMIANQHHSILNMSNVISSNGNNGFTYNGHLIQPYIHRSLTIDYYPKAILLQALFNSNIGKAQRQYKALMTLNKENELKINIVTPNTGFEEFDFYLKHGSSFIMANAKTPLINYENISFSGKLEKKEQNGKLLSFLLTRNKNVMKMDYLIHFQSKFIEMSFDIMTSFQTFKNYSFTYMNDFRSSKKMNSITASFNEDVYKVNSEIYLGNISIDAMLNIFTPIQKFRKGSLTLNCNLETASKRRLVIQGLLNDIVYFDFLSTVDNGGNKGTFSLNSQFPVVQISLIYDISNINEGHTVVTNMNLFGLTLNADMHIDGKEGQYNNGKFKAFFEKEYFVQWSIDLNVKNSANAVEYTLNSKAGIYEVKLRMITDCSNNLEFSSSVKHPLYGSGSFISQWIKDQKTIHGMLEVTWLKDKLISFETSLESTPMETLKKFSLSLKSYLKNLNLNTFIKLNENLTSETAIERKNETSAITGFFSLTTENINNNFSSITTHLEPLIISFNYANKAPEKLLDVKVKYGFRKLQFQGNYVNNKLNLTAETSFKGFSYLQLNGECSQDLLLINYQQEDSVVFILQVMKDARNTNFMISVVTPLEVVRNFTFNGTYTNFMGISSSAHFYWADGKYFIGNSEYLIGSSKFLPGFARFRVDTSLENWKLIDMYFNVTQNYGLIEIDCKFTHGSDQIEMVATLKAEDDGNTLLAINILTPTREYYVINGSYSLAKHEFYLTCLYGGEEYEVSIVQAEYKFEVKDNSEFRIFEVILPGDYRTMFQITTSPLHNHLNFTQQSETSHWGFSFETIKTEEHMLATLSLETPLQNITQMNVDIEINFSKKYILFEFNKNKEVYKIQTAIYIASDHLGGKLSVETPYFPMSNASLDIFYNKKSLNVSMEGFKQKINFRSNFMITEYVFVSNAELELPYIKSFEQTSLSISADVKNLTGSLLAFWKGNKVSFSANFNPKNLFLSLQTPFIMIPDFQFSGILTSTTSNHEYVGILISSQLRLEINSNVNIQPNNYSTESIIKWDVNKHITVQGYLVIPNMQEHNINFKSSLTLSTPEVIHSFVEFEHKKIGDLAYRSNFKLSAPVVGIAESVLAYNCSDYDSFNADFHVSLSENQKILVNLAMNIDNTDFMYGNFLFQVPLTNFPEINLYGLIDLVENTANFQVKISEIVYTFFGLCSMYNENINLALKLQLPRIINLDISVLHKPYKGEVTFIINDNQVASLYEIQKSVLFASLNLSMPSINIQKSSVHTAANYSESRIDGSIKITHQNHESKVIYNLIREPHFSRTSSKSKQKTISSNTKYYLSHFSIQAENFNERYFKNASLTILNNDKELNVFFQTDKKDDSGHQISLILKKNDRCVQLKLGESVNVELSIKSSSGFIILSHPSQVHKMQYFINLNNGFESTIEIESPLINYGRGNVLLVLQKTNSKIQGKLNTNIGSLHKSVLMQLEFGERNLVKVDIMSQNTQFFSFEASLLIEKERFTASTEIEIDGLKNIISVTHKFRFPLNSILIISSPVLLSEPLTVQLSTQEGFLANVTYGDLRNVNHTLLQLIFLPQDGKVGLNLQTPFSLKSFTIGGEFIAVINLIKFSTIISYSAHNMPPIEASFGFQFSNILFDSHIKLITPIKHHEYYEAHVHVPLNLLEVNSFNCSLILPRVKYLYLAVLEQWEERIQFISIIQHREKLANITFNLEYGSRFVIFAEINTPFQSFVHYCLDLKGQRNLKDGNNIVNYVEWNDKKIELKYSFVIETNTFLTQVELKTPFQNYDHYEMRIQYENQQHKVAVASLNYPGLNRPLDIGFDYLYKGIFDVNLIAEFSLPFLTGLNEASFLLGNKLNLARGSYQAILSGHINEKKLSLAVDGLMNPKEIELEILAQQNDKGIYLKISSALDFHKNLQFLFELQTPFSAIKRTEISLVYGPHIFQMDAYYNSREILMLDFQIRNNHINFKLKNPIRSISFVYKKEIHNGVTYSAEVCWDLQKKQMSQIGVEYFFIFSIERQEIRTKLKLPARISSFIIVNNFLKTDTVVYQENALHFSWEEGKMIGYHVLAYQDVFNSTMFGRIDLLFRSFESSIQSIRNPFISTPQYQKGELLWDATGNRNKKIGFEFQTHSNALADSTEKWIFFVHDISVQIEQYLNNSHLVLQYGTDLQIAYSSNPADVFSLKSVYAYQDSSNFSLIGGIFIHHKPSKFHFDSSIEFSNINEVLKYKLNITYLKPSTEQKVNLLSLVRLQYHVPEIEIQLKTNENYLNIGGLRWYKKGYHGLSLFCQMNQKDPLTLSTVLNKEKTSLEIELCYGKNRHYTLSGQFPNWKEISTEVSHSLNNVIVRDGSVAARLNASNLLWTRIEWSARILQDLKPVSLQEYADITYVMNAIVQSYLELLNEEFQITLPDITLSEIVDYAKAEIQDISYDFLAVGYYLSKLYERNDLFLKDICNIIKSTCSHLSNLLTDVSRLMTVTTEILYDSLKNLLSFLWDALSMDFLMEQAAVFISKIQEMINIVAENVKTIVKYISLTRELLRDTIKEILSQLRWELFKLRQNLHQISEDIFLIGIKCINSLGRYMANIIEDLEHHVSYIQVEAMVIVLEAADVVENITDTLLEIPEIKYLLETYATYASWLEEFHLQYHIDNIINIAAEAVDLLVSDITKALNDIKMLLLGSTEPYSNSVEQMPMLLCIKTAINGVYQKVVWLWKYYNITNHIVDALDEVLDDSDAMLLNVIGGMNYNSEQNSKTDLIFRPDVGLVEYTQELPVEWNGFNELPKFQQLNWYSAEQKSQEQITKLDKYSYFLLDPISTALNKSLKSLLPSFNKHAVIAGNQHFITFDNTFYDFEGECSYLLASDFVNNKFSAVINYKIQNHEVVRKSLTIITEGHHIIIGNNHRVSIDGMKTELPVKIGQSTKITRSGATLLVETPFGMSIECNIHHDICTMTLSGWYFGKTGGLFGTLDNEPSNDISLPDGSITRDIELFANSWQVGKEAQCQPKVPRVNKQETLIYSLKYDRICSSYFQQPSSPLSSCFSYIDPQPYYELCLQNENNGCLAAVTYITQCKKIDVDVWVPPECVSCQLPDGTILKAGEGKILSQDTPQSADIVLVVEQSSCLQSVRIIDIITKLDTALKIKGISDARYSVVGFAGKDFNRPHSYTANGEIWTTKKLIDKALKSLQFDAESSQEDVNMYGALWYAAQLPFRGGVSKTIVLIQCNVCNDQVQMNEYNDMLRILQENSISLHILQPDIVQLEVSPQKLAKVFGMDMEGTYSARNLANLTPKKNLLRQVRLPKDLCTPLALESNGTIFNLNHMIGEKAQTNGKRFLDVWSRRIARDVLPLECQKCQCVVDQDSVGRMMCSKCLFPSREMDLPDLDLLWSAETGDSEVFY